MHLFPYGVAVSVFVRTTDIGHREWFCPIGNGEEKRAKVWGQICALSIIHLVIQLGGPIVCCRQDTPSCDVEIQRG